MVPGPHAYSDPVPGEGLTVAEKQAILDEQWQKKIDRTRKMLDDSLEYDDEDPVCLDNMGQFLYRIVGDKAAAKEWFDKAHEEKPGQIDSLWFLSRYDVEAGDTAAAIEKLETIADRFDIVYASHRALEVPTDILPEQRQAARDILDGKIPGREPEGPFPCKLYERGRVRFYYQ